MVNLSRGLYDEGYEVDLVLAQAEGPLLHDISRYVDIVDLEASRVRYSLPGLVQYLRRNHPHTLFSTLGYANVIALLACRISGSPSRVVVREANTISHNQPPRIVEWLMRWTYPWADAVIANSIDSGDALIAEGIVDEDQLQVIPNPTITDGLMALQEKPVNETWFSDDDPVILGVGRLEPQKDFATLIEGFSRLREEIPARLIILGEGSEREALENLAQELQVHDSVKLPGFVENPHKYMERADIVANTSRWEGAPNVIPEALAAGTPVVATDCPGGTSDMLAGGEYGRLVPVGNSQAVAEALEDSIADPATPSDLRERGKRFHLDTVLPQYERVLFPDLDS